VLIKANAVELLRKELGRKRRKGIIGTGSMNDPYMPLEASVKLTQRALEVIAEQMFGVHIVTKSDLVVRDIPILKKIARVGAAVSLSITTSDDLLARKVEPHSPPPSARFRALKQLAAHGIETRVALMPTLPFIEDSWDNVSGIVERAQECGVKTIVPWFGMSMRDRQRSYYYARLDELFPGLRTRYEAAYGNAYSCPSPNAKPLSDWFAALCASHGIATSARPHLAPTAEQIPLA